MWGGEYKRYLAANRKNIPSSGDSGFPLLTIGVSLIKTFLPSSFHSSNVFKFDPHYWSTELEYVSVF